MSYEPTWNYSDAEFRLPALFKLHTEAATTQREICSRYKTLM